MAIYVESRWATGGIYATSSGWYNNLPMANTAELFSPLHSISFTFVSRCVVCVCVCCFSSFFFRSFFLLLLSHADEKNINCCVCSGLAEAVPYRFCAMLASRRPCARNRFGLRRGASPIRGPADDTDVCAPSPAVWPRFSRTILRFCLSIGELASVWFPTQRLFFFFSFFLFVLSFGW